MSRTGRRKMYRKRKLSSILSAVVLISASVLIFNIQGSASASAGGDNGTIKTHNVGTPTDDVNDEPKLACDGFYLDAFGFDGVQQVDWWITEDTHGDTKKSGIITLDDAGHGFTGTLDLPDGMYKLYWTFEGQNGEAKHKVFKIEGCEEPPPSPDKILVAGDVQFAEGSVKCVTDVVVVTPPSYTVAGNEHVVYDTARGSHPAAFGQTVTVNATGVDDPSKYQLSGQTTWTHTFGPVPAAPSDCGSVNPPTDVCPNIDGPQNQVPRGLVLDSAGNCVPVQPPDLCPNIKGYQTALPPGYTLVKGQCVNQHADAPKPQSTPSAQPLPHTGA